MRLEDIPEIDLFVTGCVAVTLKGERLGKGEGCADREYVLLLSAEKLSPLTPVLTTVHPLQIVPEIPVEAHDLKVDLIVTPEQIFRVSRETAEGGSLAK